MTAAAQARRARALVGELERYSPLFASTTDYVFAKDLAGTYVAANPAYLSALGLAASEVVGRDDRTVFPARDAEEHLARERLVQLCGYTVENETSLPINGQTRDLVVRRSPWRSAAGNLVGTIAVATDITQARETRARDGRQGLQRRGSNARLQQMLADQKRFSRRMAILLDAGRELIVALDSGRIHRVAVDVVEQSVESVASAFATYNRSTDSWTIRACGTRGAVLRQSADTFGAAAAPFSDDVLRGRVFTRSRVRSSLCGFDAAAMAGGFAGYVALPVTYERALQAVLLAAWSDDGLLLPEELWFLESLSVQVSLALHNAALYEQLDASLLTLRRVQDQASHATHLQALGQVASGVAHDFNNSLTTILGLSDWLLHELPAETPFYADLETIRTAAQDAAAMVRRLQMFGRLRPEARHELTETVDLAEVARAVVDLTRPRRQELSAKTSCRFEVVVDSAGGPFVTGSAAELRELLVNLVFNGLDAMPDGGSVRVGTRLNDGRPEVSVSDTGTGMTDEVKGRIFEPFFSTKGHKGNGLGLPMCVGIADRHGARLAVESTPGAGTTFVLTFASAAAAEPREAPADALPQQAPTRHGLRLVHSSEAGS